MTNYWPPLHQRWVTSTQRNSNMFLLIPRNNIGLFKYCDHPCWICWWAKIIYLSDELISPDHLNNIIELRIFQIWIFSCQPRWTKISWKPWREFLGKSYLKVRKNSRFIAQTQNWRNNLKYLDKLLKNFPCRPSNKTLVLPPGDPRKKDYYPDVEVLPCSLILSNIYGVFLSRQKFQSFLGWNLCGSRYASCLW